MDCTRFSRQEPEKAGHVPQRLMMKFNQKVGNHRVYLPIVAVDPVAELVCVCVCHVTHKVGVNICTKADDYYY